VQQLESEPESLDINDVPEAPRLPTLEELLAWLLTTLAAEGLSQAIVVDLTQESLGIPVVHVTIPGLEELFGKLHAGPTDATPAGGFPSLMAARPAIRSRSDPQASDR